MKMSRFTSLNSTLSFWSVILHYGETVGLPLLPSCGRVALLPLTLETWIQVSFLIFFLFIFPRSDVVLLTGSLKRPVASRPASSHLRVLHSPLSSGLNPEGIYV